jgi:type II secretory pathway pseudopilin PulG
VKLRPRHGARRDRSGFTILEAVIAISLMALLLVNVSMLTESSTSQQSAANRQLQLDQLCRRAVDRMANELLEASYEHTVPIIEAPASTEDIRYLTSLGYSNGEEVLSPLENILLDPEAEQILWIENPGEAEERRIVLSSDVSELMLGEEGENLEDDNENLVVDEAGLALHVDGRIIVIELTLRKEFNEQELVSTAKAEVCFRN